MKWQTNQNLTEEKINEVINKINTDDVINRLCQYLKITKESLFTFITMEDLNRILATLLINRGLDSNIDLVLNEIHKAITNPLGLANAKEAAELIASYCANPNANIIVFGDYDADGITAGYITTAGLRDVAKCEVNVRYPERHEGYGLNMDYCEELVARNIEDLLVITVDNGVTCVEEINYLKANGIEVVVLDHHTSKEEVPNCIIVDPHNKHVEQDDTYKHLCGCGVAFKVIQLVHWEFNNGEKIKKYTPYLAISTLADVMPLHVENMAFIQYGLDIINSKKCPIGLVELKKQLKLDIVTADDILWTIAPIINACGRLGDTALGSKLFFIEDDEPITEIISSIIQMNEKRKTITKKAIKDLQALNFDNDKVCIIEMPEYPAGIHGILAGKATELFGKPSIVVGVPDRRGIVHGSSRSAQGIDLQEIFTTQVALGNLVNFGGHAEAAGVAFKLDNIQKLRDSFNEMIEYVVSTEPVEIKEPVLLIDEILTDFHINKIVYALSNIIPFDNRTYSNPTYALCNLELVPFTKSDLVKKKWNKELKKYDYLPIPEWDKQFIGKPYRLSENNPENIELNIKYDNSTIRRTWAWRLADKYINELKCPSAINIAGEIKKDSFKGQYSLNILDIMASN